MPNPDLGTLLVDAVTRRRYTASKVRGQTRLTHGDEPGITCGIKPVSPELRRKGRGVVANADYLVTLQPEADVRGADPVTGTPADVLIVSAGRYAGQLIQVEFVHQGSVIPHRKVEGLRLQELPISTPAP